MDHRQPFEYLDNNTFSFACHPGLSCFTECCRDLRLALTPYDILRLKNKLGVNSGDFLDQYTTVKPGEHNGFPAVLLKMGEDEVRPCPCVTPSGCRIYEDRPGACRIYPIGRASSRTQGQEQAREFHFVVKEPHCQGFNEPEQWTVEHWALDQGLKPYSFFNDEWTGIITHKGSPGSEEAISRKMQMFFMACYDLDQFRRFVFESTFLRRFDIPEEIIKRMKTDDEELLKLSLLWLKFSLFGEKGLPLRPE
ncbi:MAG: YkgJ family cysteine cluster protein [Deltaproteobacteria bacterium]|nr:YkgJ family cysteine cluster protein [Deltaproteobacteria bacterium]